MFHHLRHIARFCVFMLCDLTHFDFTPCDLKTVVHQITAAVRSNAVLLHHSYSFLTGGAAKVPCSAYKSGWMRHWLGIYGDLEFMSELPVWGHLPDQWYQSVFCPFLVFGVAGEAGFENFLFVVNPDDDEWDI